MKVRITRVHPDAALPVFATPGAVGFDLPLVEAVVVPARGSVKARTGLVFAVPEDYGLFVFARSSTFGKTGLVLANGVGVLDQDFCGPNDELRLHLWNPGDADISLDKGVRLAQGVFLPILKPSWDEGEATAALSRGGFGSTGR